MNSAGAYAAARLTPQRMRESLAAALAERARLSPQREIWVFGYGSLIWRPEFAYDRRLPARVFGYHRRLCLRSVLYRGTPECPGLVAGLDRGGSCAGVAYRLRAASAPRELERLWEREMFMGSYAARWLRARPLAGGAPLLALAFVVRHDAPNYGGQLCEAEIIDVLRRACGTRGTSLEYLQHTVAALRAEGLCDPHLERLLRRTSAVPSSASP
ncbi:MAG: gamma-glutamylcyclotransferase [Betaproteobacteria bacterium]